MSFVLLPPDVKRLIFSMFVESFCCEGQAMDPSDNGWLPTFHLRPFLPRLLCPLRVVCRDWRDRLRETSIVLPVHGTGAHCERLLRVFPCVLTMRVTSPLPASLCSN